MIKAIVLAAGKGTRMNSSLPKVVHKVCGAPMVEHVITALFGAGVTDICVVVGYEADTVKTAIEDTMLVKTGNVKITYVTQQEQLGTGHAVKCAADFIGDGGSVLVLCGDTPLIKASTLRNLIEFKKTNGCDVVVLSAVLDDPTGYGRIIRDGDGEFIKNVEHKDATESERASHEVNSGMYIFDSKKLYEALFEINNNNAQGEYYLPDTLEIILKKGGVVDAVAVKDPSEINGVNTPVQLEAAEKIMCERMKK